MRPFPSRSFFLVLFVALLHLGARSAGAAEADKPWSALFERCQKLSNEGDYTRGLEACEQAYALNPDPGILAYIAQIHTALLHPVQAREVLRRYLKAGDLDSAERKMAEAQVRYLDTLIGTLSITTRLEVAEFRVDDQVVDEKALTRGVPLTAGAHRVTLKTQDTSFERYVVLRGGEQTQLELPGNAWLALSCASPKARFFIDDQEIGSVEASRGVPRTAGSHRVRCEAEGSAWPEARVPLAPDQRVSIVCAGATRTPTGPAQASMNQRGYWVTGVGLLLGGAALATAIYNGSEYDRWKTANDDLRESILNQELPLSEQVRRAQENNQLMSSIQTRRNVALGLGIAGGVVTAGGVALLFADSATLERKRASSWFTRVATGLTLGATPSSGQVAWQGAW